MLFLPYSSALNQSLIMDSKKKFPTYPLTFTLITLKIKWKLWEITFFLCIRMKSLDHEAYTNNAFIYYLRLRPFPPHLWKLPTLFVQLNRYIYEVSWINHDYTTCKGQTSYVELDDDHSMTSWIWLKCIQDS